MAFNYEVSDTVTGIPVSKSKIDPDAVHAVTQDISYWRDRSRLPRALLGGTFAMRLAGNEFLPKHSLEADKAYTGRLKRSTLLGAFKKTVSFLAGQVFQSDIVFNEEVNPQYQEWIKAIDSKGNDLDVFAKRVFQNGLGKGMSAIFIDVPKRGEGTLSKADEKAAGIRPFFKEIKPENFIGAIVDDNGFLVQVRFSEAAVVRLGMYGTKTVERVRVLEPGRWYVHEIDSKGVATLVESGVFSIPVIPFVIFIPGEEWSIITGETPLIDLADLNAKHWRSMSDQDNILSVARVPILFGRNIELNKMPVGVATMVTSEDDNADIKFVEIQGNAISAGREDIKETEAQMALYGLQQLVPRSGNLTATEKALTSAESNSALGTWATEFESVMNECFKIMGLFMGIEWPEQGLTLNKEYNFGIADAAELQALLKANEQGVISAQATFSEFRRRGVFEEHLDWSDMEADLEQEKRDSLDMAQLAGSAFGTDTSKTKDDTK